MARTNEWTETLVDWVDGRLRQNRFSNLWLGGGPGADGGSSYRPIDGQLTQRHVCYDTSEDASPCSPSGFSSLVDNLRRIRYWQEPATWFGVTTSGAPASGSYLNVYIKPGLWYPSTTEYCAFAGGDSPTFTLPSGVLDRVDTIYVDASGILHIQHGTPAVLPTITLPPIASGIPLWAVHLTPTASGITFTECSGYYSGMGYIERDLRPFLNLGGGGAVASGVLPAATAEGQALVSNAALEWIADTTPLWKGEHSFEAGMAFVGATTENSITIPDAQTQAFHIIDTGATEFLRLDTYNEYFIIDPAGVGIKVGIGVNPPDLDLHVHGSLSVTIKLTNDDTGIAGNVGFDIGVATDETAYLWNYENTDLMLATNSTCRIMILAGGNVGIGVLTPNQKLTVEGTIDLKEQAAANADVASYGQIWVKNTAPNELWFTDDAGADVQLGVTELPNVAGAGYALVSDGVNSWVSDQTPAWTGVHTHAANIVLDDGVGDSPQLQFIGGSNDDTARIFLGDDAVAGNSDLVIRLCAADTGSRLTIHDSASVTAAYIDADGNADFAGHVAIGNNASVDTNLMLLVDENLTAVAGVWTVGRFIAKATHAAPSAVKLYAVRAIASQGSASAMTASNALVGFYGGVSIVGTGLVKKGRGLWSVIATSDAAGAMTTGIGVESSIYGTAGMALTLTDLYHYYVDSTPGSATFTVTNHYGLYMQNIALGSVLNYAIYTNTGLVHFGDQVEIIGSAAADIQLIVKGTAAQSASLVQYQDSAAAIFFDSGDGLANSAVVWNEQGLDIDFRVEAVGQVNALFVQGSDGKVGIGIVPAAPLTVQANVSSHGIRVIGRSDDYGLLQFFENDGVTLEGVVYGFTGRLTLSGPDATNDLNIVTGGNVGVGTTIFGTNAVKVLGIRSGTAPTTSPIDMIQIFSVDTSDATATLGLRTEQVVEAGAPTMSHKLKVLINGTEYWIGLDAV